MIFNNLTIMNSPDKKDNFKKISLLLLFVLLTTASAWAQRPSGEEMQRIQDAKIAIITNRLNLTPEQATGFWPVYNEYSQKRRDIHRSQRKIINDKKEDGKTDVQVLNNLKDVQDLKQQELDLEKEYQNRFLKVISASQIIELYKAERTFNDMLIQRLKQRQGRPNE
jgi:Spy/CpxP family protein refolding chaperone